MNGINWFSFTAADGYDYGLTLPLLCLAAVIIFTAVLMNYTRLGRQVYAMGGNRDAASRLGLNLLKLHFYVYGYMGILAGVAAVVQAQITQSVAPNSLLGFELTVLAAVVLGGTSMSGGRGTLTGTLLGVVLLAFLQNGLTLLSVSSYWHTVFSGAIIWSALAPRHGTKNANWQGSFEMKTIARFLPGDAIIRLQCVIIVVVAWSSRPCSAAVFSASLTSSRLARNCRSLACWPSGWA